MSWVEVFSALVVCHLVGDFLLQTEFQATNKYKGLGPDPVCRRALRNHVLTYTLAFVPVLVWIGIETDAAWAILIGAVVAIPHWIQDDGRLLTAYVVRVKHTDPARHPSVAAAADQSFHFVALFMTALWVGV